MRDLTTQVKAEEIKLEMQKRINESEPMSTQEVDDAWNTVKFILQEFTEKVLEQDKNKAKKGGY